MHRSRTCDIAACSGCRGEDKLVVKTVQVFTQMIWYVLSHLGFLFVFQLFSWFLVVFLGGVDNSCWGQVWFWKWLKKVADAVLMTSHVCYQKGGCCLHSSDPLSVSLIWPTLWPSNEILPPKPTLYKIPITSVSLSLWLSAISLCRLRRPIVEKKGVSLSKSLKGICSAFVKIVLQVSLHWYGKFLTDLSNLELKTWRWSSWPWLKWVISFSTQSSLEGEAGGCLEFLQILRQEICIFSSVFKKEKQVIKTT